MSIDPREVQARRPRDREGRTSVWAALEGIGLVVLMAAALAGAALLLAFLVSLAY